MCAKGPRWKEIMVEEVILYRFPILGFVYTFKFKALTSRRETNTCYEYFMTSLDKGPSKSQRAIEWKSRQRKLFKKSPASDTRSAP